MQYSYISIFKKAGIGIPWKVIIKTLAFLIIVSYLAYSLKNEEGVLMALIAGIKNVYHSERVLWLMVPVFLVPLNWSLEALKWQALSKNIADLSFKQSISGVLAGLSLGFITPQSLGDYAGRLLLIKGPRRGELVGAIFFGSIIQSSISILGSFWALSMYIKYTGFSMGKFWSAFFLGFIIIWGILTLLKNKFNSPKPILIVKLNQFTLKYFGIIKEYTFLGIFKVIIFSFFRYLVFVVQFVLVLVLFEVRLPLNTLFAGVSWIYAAKTIIPAFNFLSDLGVREFSALLYFQNFQVEASKIILSSLFIWLINIFIPTLLGTFFVFKLRFSGK